MAQNLTHELAHEAIIFKEIEGNLSIRIHICINLQSIEFNLKALMLIINLMKNRINIITKTSIKFQSIYSSSGKYPRINNPPS